MEMKAALVFSGFATSPLETGGASYGPKIVIRGGRGMSDYETTVKCHLCGGLIVGTEKRTTRELHGRVECVHADQRDCGGNRFECEIPKGSFRNPGH
jgi:hypothetical protein